MPKIRPRSSRRAPPLKEDDFDHEINLVDQSAGAPSPQSVPPDTGLQRSSTSESNPEPGPSASRQTTSQSPERSLSPNTSTAGPSINKVPTVEIEEATPVGGPEAEYSHPQAPSSPETAIDILYENERGAFVCGVGLFSSKALGNLDPPPWTNSAHKPSPTNINTAQVPDPSWEWAWPDWRVNHDEGTDEGGWEYSFAFSKKFSWHGPSWWNSFVRRRAWIRKRVKKGAEDLEDPHLLNREYFTVRPASQLSHTTSRVSRASSRVTSKGSISQVSRVSRRSMEPEMPEKFDIEDIETLLDVLRFSRIDREKIEAVENFLEHGGDELVHLQEQMHEIMSLFVFQASRRILLTKLTEVYDEALKKVESEGTAEWRRRADNLKAAVKHADEEVRRLEYWSDVKSMIEAGHSSTAVDEDKGWDEGWQGQGLGNSGPAEPPARP
ncbi:hypothetical protein NKR23_g1416 [Pleurostoma richardsiae]|uniref:Meiotically up-regulated 65 protein n=1 Tax=Pleurostoma richardsiae TaxID=41990 RepID=A0AA38VXA6_9PEZI|nr:hypothetical protein NKR23_g1416 [Pleurostoma richardsiae]